jgi:hypothetical protein
MVTPSHCPLCGTQTTRSQAGHDALCLPCTEAELGETYEQIRDRATARTQGVARKKWSVTGGSPVVKPTKPEPTSTALDIIHRYALTHQRFSAEDLRADFDARGVKQSSRGPAFGVAKHKDYIEPDGFAKSTGASAKGAHLQTYRSLIYVERKTA